MNPKSTCRTLLRQQRQQLSVAVWQTVSQTLCERVLSLAAYQAAERIGLYWPDDQEADPRFLLTHTPDKQFFLPTLKADRTLSFRAYTQNTPLIPNRFGIPEPDDTQPTVAIAALDIVFVPFVGVDQAGYRLGRGGGYYDRTFAFKTEQRTPLLPPQLWGLAFPFQVVPNGTFPIDPWDIPLDRVITVEAH